MFIHKGQIESFGTMKRKVLFDFFLTITRMARAVCKGIAYLQYGQHYNKVWCKDSSTLIETLFFGGVDLTK